MAHSISADGISRSDRLYLVLFCVLICCLPLSYQPLIHLGEQSGANIDISLIYPVMAVLGCISLPRLWRQRKALMRRKYNVFLLAFAGWNLLAITWSDNPLRGTLVAGLICLATIVFLSIQTRKTILIKYKNTLLACLTMTTVVLCLFSLWQLFGDALNVSNALTLLPSTYQYQVFGYARVTGFAAEPQFLGSFLLIPLGLFLSLATCRQKTVYFWLFAVVTITITLTVSRGALIGMFVVFLLTAVLTFKHTSLRRLATAAGVALAGMALGVALLAYASEINRADDVSGRDAFVKTISQLSLGLIDATPMVGNTDTTAPKTPQDKAPAQPATDEFQHAPGYVEESTDSRLSMSQEALALVGDSPARLLFGIGTGSFGATLHDKSSTHSVTSIVNNQYIEVLTELGVIGLGLFIGFFALVYRTLIIRQAWLFIPVISAPLVQWLFFSGYPNVLHLWPLLGLALILPVHSKGFTRPEE